MQIRIREWLKQMREEVVKNPRRAPLYFLYVPYQGLWYTITSRWPVGTNVYERDWDVLIVLDACRVDTLREVASEYEFLDGIETMWSVGSQSGEWIANTFREEYLPQIQGTVLVTANGFTDRVLADGRYPPYKNSPPIQSPRWTTGNISDFDDVQLVWKDHHDPELGVVPPRVLTDYAIDASRGRDPDRLIVHYLQPHRPYIAEAVREQREPTPAEKEGYELLERNESSREEIYSMYRDNLRFVLDDVELLLENVDADTVAITSDHGESFGEGGAYGHPEGFPHPVVKRVPWVETSATDTGGYSPDISAHRTVDTDIESHLQDLGYL